MRALRLSRFKPCAPIKFGNFREGYLEHCDEISISWRPLDFSLPNYPRLNAIDKFRISCLREKNRLELQGVSKVCGHFKKSILHSDFVYFSSFSKIH